MIVLIQQTTLSSTYIGSQLVLNEGVDYRCHSNFFWICNHPQAQIMSAANRLSGSLISRETVSLAK